MACDMKQLFLIGGWEVFDTKDEYYNFLKNCDRDLQNPKKNRKNRLCDSVSLEFKCIVPQMPNWMNADYMSRKIRFEKYFKYLNGEEVVLIWRSLWAMFLLRYLSETDFPSHLVQIHLIAPERKEEWLNWFSTAKNNLQKFESQCDTIYIYHSKDDDIVSFENWERLSKAIPWAIFEVFETRKHFITPAFPELLDNIWIYSR